MRVALPNGSGHEDVGNAHLKDKEKGELLERVKKVGLSASCFKLHVETPRTLKPPSPVYFVRRLVSCAWSVEYVTGAWDAVVVWCRDSVLPVRCC